MDLRPDTIAIRTQAQRSPYNEHSVPIYATSGYQFDTAGTAADAFAGTTDHPLYARFDNPNTDEFALKIARLEETETAIATASGMGAIFTTLAGLLRNGDHIVAGYQLFGSTLSLLNEFLPRWGIESTLVDGTDLAAWEGACRRNTRVLLCETPSNPGLEVVDIQAVAEIARSRGALLVVDNCFATPLLQRPAALGADIVVHSATKFIDGQGRVLGGAIATSRDVMEQIMPFYRTTGPTMSAFNGWILSRGLETLGIRMEKHCDNTEELVRRFIDSGIGRVRFPGLPEHPQYELSRKQMRRPGALFTVDLGSHAPAAMEFLDRLRLVSRSVNLGDTRTIATHPYTTTHAKVPEAMKAKLGITPGLVRFSVGLEDVDDLWNDITGALGV